MLGLGARADARQELGAPPADRAVEPERVAEIHAEASVIDGSPGQGGWVAPSNTRSVALSGVYALRRRARRVGTTVRRARRARFTAPAFGNAWAMSGSSTTTFVPSRYRAAYLPRIPLRKSYSGRIVSRSVDRLVLFLIGSSFSAGRPPRTDYPDRLAAFRMSDNEEPPTGEP